jgi:hypothetical protein
MELLHELLFQGSVAVHDRQQLQEGGGLPP